MKYFKLFIKKHFILTPFLIVLGGIIGWQISLSPQTEKNWRSENQFFPEISESGDTIHISFLRDFYSSESGKSFEVWKTEDFQKNLLSEISLGVSHFSEEHYGAAHTFLHFAFSDGKSFNVSFESRLEEGESYSPWKGLLRQNELYIAIGTDRDVIGERVGRKKEKVFLYPLNISAEMQQKVLKSTLSRIKENTATPEFYNTLTDNCTTSLVGIAEESAHKNFLWGYSHLLPGYFDKKLFTMGLLKNPENFSEEEFDLFKKSHAVLSAKK